MNELLTIVMLMTAPSMSDYDLEVNSVQAGSYQTMAQCAEASVSFDVAYCVSITIEVAQ